MISRQPWLHLSNREKWGCGTWSFDGKKGEAFPSRCVVFSDCPDETDKQRISSQDSKSRENLQC